MAKGLEKRAGQTQIFPSDGADPPSPPPRRHDSNNLPGATRTRGQLPWSLRARDFFQSGRRSALLRPRIGALSFLIPLPLWGFCVVVRTATLTGTFTPVPQGSVVNLTADGPADWVHWGLYTQSSLDRKFGVLPQIPDFKPIGSTGPYE